VEVLPLDLTNPDFIDEIAKKALNLFEHIDILIHSAGIGQRSLVKDTIAEVDRAIMKLNYFGTVELTRAVLPFMLARQSGHIVVISSVVGKIGTPMRSSYAASKHALHGYFDSLRAEVNQEGIYITLVCPGHIQTEISRNSLTGNGRKYSKVDNVLKKGMPIDQCVAYILKGIYYRKEEIIVSKGKEKFAVYLKRFFPGLFSRVIRSVNSI